MNSKTIAIVTIIAMAVGVGGFFAGAEYQKSKSPVAKFTPDRNDRTMQGQRAGGQNNIRTNDGETFETGEITAKDDKSITLKTRDGSSKIIFFSESTSVGKTIDGANSDLGVGQTVMVNGKADASGILTARVIQIRPNEPIGQNQEN